MAFDGFVISNLVSELSDKLVGGRITKISQPEKDELVLTIKNYDQFKLFISASAGLPLMYLTEQTKANPMTAPNFCMLLRKHLNSARILSITQPDFETEHSLSDFHW
jgi:predicted ribosome quality control (RQC) complex YloA/Tae2 family protein